MTRTSPTRSTPRSASRTPRRAWFSGPRARRVVKFAATGLVAAFILNMFFVPVGDYFRQRSALAQRQAEFEALADANEALQDEVNHLGTPEGIRGAARTQLGMTMPGEDRIRLIHPADLPTDLPDQWPYTLVTGILAVRTAQTSTDNPLAPLAP